MKVRVYVGFWFWAFLAMFFFWSASGMYESFTALKAGLIARGVFYLIQAVLGFVLGFGWNQAKGYPAPLNLPNYRSAEYIKGVFMAYGLGLTFMFDAGATYSLIGLKGATLFFLGIWAVFFYLGWSSIKQSKELRAAMEQAADEGDCSCGEDCCCQGDGECCCKEDGDGCCQGDGEDCCQDQDADKGCRCDDKPEKDNRG